MRRKDRERDAAFAWDVLERCPFATVAMVDHEGLPYSIPVSLAALDGKLYFHSAQQGLKTDILRECPDVCVNAVCDVDPIAEDYSTAYSSAVAFGTAHEVLDDDEKIRALHAIAERYAASNLGEFDDVLAHALARTAVWRIDVDSLTGKARDH